MNEPDKADEQAQLEEWRERCGITGPSPDNGADADLRAAAKAVLDAAERPGSRMSLNSGPNGEDEWEDYQEVPQVVLDALAAALARKEGA